jgi:hypothetical protein
VGPVNPDVKMRIHRARKDKFAFGVKHFRRLRRINPVRNRRNLPAAYAYIAPRRAVKGKNRRAVFND